MKTSTKYYKLFLSQGHDDPRILVNYGVICKQKGQNEKAIELYQRCIKDFPKYPDSYNNLSNIFREIQKIVKKWEYYL